jgi:hypothetical protein
MSSFFSLNKPFSRGPTDEVGTEELRTGINGSDNTITFLNYDRDPRKFASATDNRAVFPGSLSYAEIFYQSAPFQADGICGGSDMAANRIFDYYNNQELSDIEGDPVWTCEYDANLFTKTNYLTEYRAFLMNCTTNPLSCTAAANYYNTLIMPTFCGRQHISTEDAPCPEGQSTCSPFVAVGPEGEACRIWDAEASPEVLRIVDSVKEGYCLKYYAEKDCECLARSLNENYNAIRISSPDYCWYIPCMNSSTHLTVSRDEARVNDGDCASACSQIFNIYADVGEIVFSPSFQATIDCNFDDAENGGSGGGTGPVVEESFWEQYGDITTYIIVGVGIAVIVIILLIVIILSFKKSKP